MAKFIPVTPQNEDRKIIVNADLIWQVTHDLSSGRERSTLHFVGERIAHIEETVGEILQLSEANTTTINFAFNTPKE